MIEGLQDYKTRLEEVALLAMELEIPHTEKFFLDFADFAEKAKTSPFKTMYDTLGIDVSQTATANQMVSFLRETQASKEEKEARREMMKNMYKEWKEKPEEAHLIRVKMHLEKIKSLY